MDDLKRYIRLATVVGVLLLVLLLVLLASPEGGWAQEPGALGHQTLDRPYVHVFVAYVVAWIVIFGWLVSIGRRLRRVEERLKE